MAGDVLVADVLVEQAAALAVNSKPSVHTKEQSTRRSQPAMTLGQNLLLVLTVNFTIPSGVLKFSKDGRSNAFLKQHISIQRQASSTSLANKLLQESCKTTRNIGEPFSSAAIPTIPSTRYVARRSRTRSIRSMVEPPTLKSRSRPSDLLRLLVLGHFKSRKSGLEHKRPQQSRLVRENQSRHRLLNRASNSRATC